MKVIRTRETSGKEHNEAVRQAFLGRTVEACGMAEFPPGLRAHEGEEHKHEHDEVFIVLVGEITVPIAAGPTDLARAGDWVRVAAGEEHHLTNHTNLPCRCLFFILKK